MPDTIDPLPSAYVHGRYEDSGYQRLLSETPNDSDALAAPAKIAREFDKGTQSKPTPLLDTETTSLDRRQESASQKQPADVSVFGG